MRLKTLVFLLLLVASAKAQSIIDLEALCVKPYCGGARPTEEMERDALQPKPYALKILVIVSSKNKIDSVKTNEKGEFKLRVKKGDYKVYEAWRYYKSTPHGESMDNYDAECLKTEWQKHFMEIKVRFKSIRSNAKIIEEYCPWNVPCILEQHLPPRRQ